LGECPPGAKLSSRNPPYVTEIGIAVLGLATEVSKLSVPERRQIVEWVAEDIGGRVPLAVTIAGATPAAQIEAVRHAEAQGAT
jgi:4-hydroxy-tetrahydrodipicolinate synthase